MVFLRSTIGYMPSLGHQVWSTLAFGDRGPGTQISSSALVIDRCNLVFLAYSIFLSTARFICQFSDQRSSC